MVNGELERHIQKAHEFYIPTRIRILQTRKVSQGEGVFLSAKYQPFQDWYIEPAV